MKNVQQAFARQDRPPKIEITRIGVDPRTGSLKHWCIDGKGIPGSVGMDYTNPLEPLYGGYTVDELITIWEEDDEGTTDV